MSGNRSLAGRVKVDDNAPSVIDKADEPEAAQRRFRAYGWVSALSGVVFATLFVLGLDLVRRAPGLAVPDSTYTAFYSSGNSAVLVTIGLHIVPFAGIAFLWHMGATRSLVLAALAGWPCSAMSRQWACW